MCGEDGRSGGKDGCNDRYGGRVLRQDGRFGEEDGLSGGKDGCNDRYGGWGLRQICANFAGRRDKSCATFCASGRCANGLKTNCLEWQKTRRRPRFLSKNAV